ncbi:hypothetical protein BCR37DRAFT_132947 [Protomyces lactucae-debilis]|uniref:NAD(P)-binding protein n=1 Tax=Protomyces lactucae-debilis TaxID=2754530 RepID=A0A1Y2FWC2_PROLT|nr:uncharacterized protein BCR37DRAFT_132947 [Protomyces lactucae-debilis]ORY86955.1 hypothetical protein BCR37DRAFT_132947 [Protomyces lactucae-debilis]
MTENNRQQHPFDQGNPNPDAQHAWPGDQDKLDPDALNTTLPSGPYRPANKLEDKTALITGGDSGIGRAVAIMYALEGADVAINYLHEEQKNAEQTKQLVEKHGRQCHLLPGDLRTADFCRQLVDQAAEKLGGKIDILVNNAAYQMECQELKDLSDEQWDRTFKTNVYPIFWITKQAVSKDYMPRGSAIVNNASVNAYIGRPDLADYTATKGAVISFTRALANMLVGKGIRANAVAPGPILTPLVMSTFSKDNIKGADAVPMGRPGQPSEVATSFVFLGGPDSSYITGNTIHINGGMFVGN